jgi:hypothetical protein
MNRARRHTVKALDTLLTEIDNAIATAKSAVEIYTVLWEKAECSQDLKPADENSDALASAEADVRDETSSNSRLNVPPVPKA